MFAHFVSERDYSHDDDTKMDGKADRDDDDADRAPTPDLKAGPELEVNDFVRPWCLRMNSPPISTSPLPSLSSAPSQCLAA